MMLWCLFITMAAGMLINPAKRTIMLAPRSLSSRPITDSTKLQELQARMRCPIACGLRTSSWFHERTAKEQFPLYLLSYAADHKAMMAHHRLSMDLLKTALEKRVALTQWAVGASNWAQEVLPDDAAKLLRVYYLDLLVTISKLSPEEKEALLQDLQHLSSNSHMSELYWRFISEYHQVKSAEHREAIISDCRPEFLADLIVTGREEMLETMRLFIPGLRNNEKLVQQALGIWSEANQELSRAIETGKVIPSHAQVAFMTKAYRERVYGMRASEKRKRVLRDAGRFIAAHCTDIWEIFLIATDFPIQDKE
jgi:hypothetical protein